MGIKEDPARPGTFIISYSKRDPKTRQARSLKRRGFKTKADAKRAFAKLVLDVEERLRAKRIPAWSALLDAYLLACEERGLSGKTVTDYGFCLRAHTQEWNSRLVDSITTQEVRELHQRRLGSKSVSQQKGLLKMIRGVFSHGLDTGCLTRNPTPNISFKTADKIKKVLTEPQARTFLELARTHGSEWYAVWVTAIYTGMRSGELYALTWDKVNFDTQQILVDCAWNSIDGFKSTKSGDDRVVDVAPPLMTLLKKWRLERNDSAFVLPRLDKWEVGEQARELRMFLMGTGLPPIRFHDLRATWATLMLSKGVEPIKVMSMGGWKDLKTMMIYARKAGVDIKGVAAVLSDLHNPSKEPGKLLKLGSSRDLSLEPEGD